MREFDVFDILGPIMIGPSSSHTAGAARLGKIAQIITGSEIKSVDFYLHGSFAKTYKGHGTDKALVAGILGMNPSDERLRDSFSIAKKKGIDFKFIETDLGDVHPNTVKFCITRKDGRKVSILGSSIGGGSILISEIDGEKIEFTGDYPTLIIKQRDVPGVISDVTAILYRENINVAFMKVFRSTKGEKASMIFETDSKVTDNAVLSIKKLKNVTSVRVIDPLERR